MSEQNGQLAGMTNEQIKERLNQTTDKFSNQKKGELVIDFDEAIKAQKAEAIKVKFDGELYDMPPEAPAWLPLFINRNSDDNGVLNDSANLELVQKLLGNEFADKIMDGSNNFVSFEAVNTHVLLPIMNHWGLTGENVPDEEAEKKTLTPD